MKLVLALALGFTLAGNGQTVRKPFEARSLSTVSLANNALRTTNVTFEVIRDRLLLRTTTSSMVILDEAGSQATTKLEAWPLGTSLALKPLYTIQASGTGGHTVDGALFVIDRGLEDVEWWSVYQLRTGRHLFDTYVPLVGFSISRETLERRYLGLEIPPDDAKDARLKQPGVVGVVTYLSADSVKREALLTCDDPKQAQLLRSYADSTRTLSLTDEIPPNAFRIQISQNAPSPANPVAVTIGLAGDDLDLTHAVLPQGLHVALWKR